MAIPPQFLKGAAAKKKHAPVGKKKKQSNLPVQTRAQALAEDKRTPGKHNPYSKQEALKEAFGNIAAKRKKASGG